MLKYIEEFGQYVQIAGFRDANIREVNALCSHVKEIEAARIQFFDADKIASWEHLYFAALNTLKAFQNRTNACRDITFEILRFASAQRQIKQAISTIGITPRCSRIAVVVIGERKRAVDSGLKTAVQLIGGKRDETVLELSPSKKPTIRKVFEISSAELEVATKNARRDEALVDLVLERVALVSTQR